MPPFEDALAMQVCPEPSFGKAATLGSWGKEPHIEKPRRCIMRTAWVK